jgi:hypothetical protein
VTTVRYRTFGFILFRLPFVVCVVESYAGLANNRSMRRSVHLESLELNVY